MFGWAGYFNGEWESAYKKWLGVNARVNLKSFAKAKLGSISLVLIAIVVMTALLPGVVAGEITIGIFMALVSNIFSLVQLMTWSLHHSVSEIAQEVGFGDASNFSTRFVKATGQSPLQYRKSALKSAGNPEQD